MTDHNSMTDQQLDELCAEKVMGWKHIGTKYYDGQCLRMNDDSQEVNWYGVWRPCTNLNQAVMVAERVGKDITIEKFSDEWEVVIGIHEGQASHTSPARALVIACLMAVEQRGE